MKFKILGSLMFLYGLMLEGETCKISFRLDDIQDFWLGEAQRQVIDKFVTYDVPLTIGVIANFFGSDPQIVSYLQNVTTNYPIEVAEHGWNHEDFTHYSYSEQYNKLNQSRFRIRQSLPQADLVTFIPPFNAFNEETLSAMSDLGYTHLSSSVGIDSGPFSNTEPIYRYPVGASTDSFNNNPVGVPASRTLEQIQTQIQTYGWSVVMLHPQEFNNNATMLFELSSLLEQVKTLGCSLCLFRYMHLSPDISSEGPFSCISTPGQSAQTGTTGST